MSFSQFSQVITVERVTKTGLLANGEWINLGKKAKDAGMKLEEFKQGQSYEIQGYQSSEGKKPKYINTYKVHGPSALPASQSSVVPPAAGESTGPTSSPDSSPAAVSGKQAAAPTTYGRPLSDYDKRKDVSIRVSGIMQALIVSPTFSPGDVPFSQAVANEARNMMVEADKLIDERLK